MSFCYNPFPYNDLRPVNRPDLSDGTIASLTVGSVKCAVTLAKRIASMGRAVVAVDGYTTAGFNEFVNLLVQQLHARGIAPEVLDFDQALKSEEEFKELVDDKLSWDTRKDPTLLFGMIYHGGYEGLLDKEKLDGIKSRIAKARDASQVVIVWNYGCLISEMRPLYDIKCWLDVAPMEVTLRIRRGRYVNLGMSKPLTTNLIIRRCYYCDYEVAVNLRKDLLQSDALDYYVDDNRSGEAKMLTGVALKEVMDAQVRYPFRCKPVYIEGVWGGTYTMRMRHLPKEMRNCAWVFDLIPMEVSILVLVGETVMEFPFCSFFMKEDKAMMGEKCVEKFHSYFPIRFNYDDSWHSSGNMSIQCHSGAKFNIENYGEFGRQDESYYIVATGHDAKTFIGFRDDADIPRFFKEIEAADTRHEEVDYMKYVSYEDSKPGLQVMLPAGTIHSSGRDQFILEIGSLTIGSYTYKMYDYLRLDFDGKQRPIHTALGEENVAQDRRTSWIRSNVVQQPRVIRSGKDWKEEIVGEHPLLYFSLRRLQLWTSIEDDTKDRFHVLVVVDGERIRVRSVDHPECFYDADYLDMVVVPKSVGHYVIENLGDGPAILHKTLLREGFENDPA